MTYFSFYLVGFFVSSGWSLFLCPYTLTSSGYQEYILQVDIYFAIVTKVENINPIVHKCKVVKTFHRNFPKACPGETINNLFSVPHIVMSLAYNVNAIYIISYKYNLSNFLSFISTPRIG